MRGEEDRMAQFEDDPQPCEVCGLPTCLRSKDGRVLCAEHIALAGEVAEVVVWNRDCTN